MTNRQPAHDQSERDAQLLEARLAALKSLQDWSKWLVGVDAGVLGLLSFAFEKGVASMPETRWWLVGAIISFCVSLIIATWLVGAVPAFVMHLKAGDKPDKKNWWIDWSEENIYDFTYGRIRVHAYAFLQHLTFMIGAVLLTTALCIGLFATRP